MRALALKISFVALACVAVGSFALVGSKKADIKPPQIAAQDASASVTTPVASGQPLPYRSDQPGQTGWPPPTRDVPTRSAWMPPQDWQMPVQASQPMDIPAPPGMSIVPSPAGKVFMAEIGGRDGAMQLAQHTLAIMERHFGTPLINAGQQADPRGYMAQIGFTTTFKGYPVTGMISTIIDQRDSGHVYIMFDDSQTVMQSMPGMMEAVYQTQARIDAELQSRPREPE